MAVKEFKPSKYVLALALPSTLLFTLAMVLLGRIDWLASVGVFALTFVSFVLITLLAGMFGMKAKGTNVFILALLTLVMSTFLTALTGVVTFAQFTANLMTLEFWVSSFLLVASVAGTLYFLPQLTKKMR